MPTKGLSSLAFPQGEDVKGCIAFDATPWYKESDWTMSPNDDVYYIGMNGEKKKLLKDRRGEMFSSHIHNSRFT